MQKEPIHSTKTMFRLFLLEGATLTSMEDMMAQNKKMVEAITGRDEDFAKWYTDIVKKAELVDLLGTLKLIKSPVE